MHTVQGCSPPVLHRHYRTIFTLYVYRHAHIYRVAGRGMGRGAGSSLLCCICLCHGNNDARFYSMHCRDQHWPWMYSYCLSPWPPLSLVWLLIWQQCWTIGIQGITCIHSLSQIILEYPSQHIYSGPHRTILSIIMSIPCWPQCTQALYWRWPEHRLV